MRSVFSTFFEVRLEEVIKQHTTPSIAKKNYIIFWEYIKCVLLPLIEVMGPNINLIRETHDFCERKEYAFNVLSEYSIITSIAKQ